MRARYALSVAAIGYSKLVVAAVQIVLVPIMSLHWGLALYGQWLMLSAIPIFLAASDFGFSTAAGTRLIGEVARTETQEALVTFQSALKMVLILSGCVLAIVIAACALIPGSVLAVDGGMNGSEARLVLAILCLYGLVSLQLFLFAAVSRSGGRQPAAITTDATIQLTEGGAVCLIVVLGGSPLAAACAYLAIRSLGLLAHVMLARRAGRGWLILGWKQASGARIRELLRPAVAAMVLPLSQAAYLQGVAIALGAAGGAAMVPLYTALRTLARSARQLMMAFVTPLMPEFTGAYARGDGKLLGQMSGAVLMIYGVAGPVLALILGIWGLEILALWTKGAIQPPQAMITIMAVGLALTVVWNALGDLLLAINRHETYSYVFLFCALGAMGLTLVLVPPLGVTGAAIANLPLEIIMTVVVLTSLWRNAGKPEIGIQPFIAAIPPRWRSRLLRDG